MRAVKQREESHTLGKGNNSKGIEGENKLGKNFPDEKPFLAQRGSLIGVKICPPVFFRSISQPEFSKNSRFKISPEKTFLQLTA